MGAGAVLFQSDNSGVEQTVSFYLKKFNAFQFNYSVIEKETLALIWALQHFEVYVDSGRYPCFLCLLVSFCFEGCGSGQRVVINLLSHISAWYGSP